MCSTVPKARITLLRVAFMTTSCMEYWSRTLAQCGFHGSIDRYKIYCITLGGALAWYAPHRSRALCRLLLQNDFTRVSQLANADHPRSWPGSSDCADSELDFISKLPTVARRERSRSAHSPAMSAHMVHVEFCRQRDGPSRSDEMPDITAEVVRKGQIDALPDRPRNVTSEHAGPIAALKRLDFMNMSQAGRSRWAESARVDAIVGSCRHTMASLKSGLRCWVAFLGERHWRACCHVTRVALVLPQIH